MAPGSRLPPLPSYLAQLALLASLLVLATLFSPELTALEQTTLLIVLPAGIALGALLLWGTHLWPAVAIAALVGSLFEGSPPQVALAHAALATLEACVGASLVRRLWPDRRILSHARGVLVLVLAGAGLATALAASGDTFVDCLLGAGLWREFDATWLSAWVARGMGVLIVTPSMLAWSEPRLASSRPWGIEAALLGAAMVLTVEVVFGGWLDVGGARYALVYLPFPILVWTSFRFGARGGTTAMWIVAAMAVWGTAQRLGPFTGTSLQTSLLHLWCFLALVSMTSLVITSVVAERRFATDALLRARDELEERVALRTRELAKANEELRHKALIIDQIHDSVITTDREGKIVGWNQGAERMFGYTIAETVGRHFSMLHDDDPGFDVELEVLPELREHGSHEMDVHLLRKSGERFDAHLSLTVLRDAAGRASEVIGFAMDTTERNRVAQKLRESERMYQQTLDAMVDMILVRGREGRVIWANKAFREYFRMNNNELRKNDVAGTNPLRREAEAFVFRTGETVDLPEDPLIRYDGEERSFHTVQSAIFDSDGRVIMTVAVSRDIEDRKRAQEELAQHVHELEESRDRIQHQAELLSQQAEELTQARDAALEGTRAKSEFLARMSHEIRTPMNGVLGMTGLLLATEMEEQQRDYAQTIKSCAESLLTIINDILDFSKIEAGRLELEEVDFDLEPSIEEALDLFRDRCQKKGIELRSRYGPGVPHDVRGDSGRVRQILLNLIGNALKFTDEGWIEVRVSQLSSTAEEHVLRFEVEDTGVGIPPQAQRRLFRSFSQADSSTTRKYGGTGLGLSISKQLTELMGGDIGLDSKPGEGSLFWFTLRLKRRPEPLEPVIAPALPSGGGPEPELASIGEGLAAGARILLVEDNPVNQKLALALLRRFGCHADVASNGIEAVDAFRALPYDVVLMDCQMPVMDGFEATRRIRQMEPPELRTPILAMTANAMQGDRELCLEAGMDDYITKPVRFEVLRATLLHWLNTVRSQGWSEHSA